MPVEEQEEGNSRYDQVQRLCTAVNELRSGMEGEMRLKRKFEASTSQYRQKLFDDGIKRCLLMASSFSRFPKQKQVEMLIALDSITGQTAVPDTEPDPASEQDPAPAPAPSPAAPSPASDTASEPAFTEDTTIERVHSFIHTTEEEEFADEM